ncbi:DrsE domain-containing protein [Candidatus Hydrogenisulfobacillus filiaventi]|uniref:DrsE domain-containing protein n=1 Tax=Candidatus Hydrogenisulfobacillus filiaventi TaxID=2707344 RepID=A0A6F8ZHY9_9FIRM|nr:DsrE family protein [Bacillota bacterium]CAB1129607.1 DrsE domain-containing protein [Candidatus Hydrogenisulfobacillus filiaventi]
MADAGEQQRTLVVLTTGKEAFMRANAVLQVALVLATQGLQVQFLAIGPGIEVFKSNQRNSPQFAEMLNKMREAGVQLSVCQVSMENIGLTRDQMFDAEIVMGGRVIAQRIREGWTVLTF